MTGLLAKIKTDCRMNVQEEIIVDFDDVEEHVAHFRDEVQGLRDTANCLMLNAKEGKMFAAMAVWAGEITVFDEVLKLIDGDNK